MFSELAVTCPAGGYFLAMIMASVPEFASKYLVLQPGKFPTSSPVYVVSVVTSDVRYFAALEGSMFRGGRLTLL